jgi:DNA-binding GntR family transcriptional regulator
LTAAPLFRQIDVAPAYQKVADAIEREIVNGRIKPGEPIGTELELGRQFGVNRSTVREGIRVLEEGGLIRRDSSRRLQACLPRYNKLATRLSRALVLHEVTFRELYEASIMLEVASIECAVERATAENTAELADNLKRSEEVVSDPASLAELDADPARQGFAEPGSAACPRACRAAIFSYHRNDRRRRHARRIAAGRSPPPSVGCDPAARQGSRRIVDAAASSGLAPRL